ncbi:MAG: hypothetical protein K9G30_07230 [Parvibaculum sp.]|nr:hypothetical protein [Parvibaculum sp.]
MKRLFAIAGLASVLGLAAPVAAGAASLIPAIGVNGGAEVQLVRGGQDRYHSNGHDRSRSRRNDGYDNRRSQGFYGRHEARPWGHWRPYVERRHYHSFGAPVYYRHHPRYGDYYRVRARDRNNVAVWLGISAITGAILFSTY